MISTFEVSNYKGFGEPQAINASALTLLFGQNSSGKSALLRLLPWIAESMIDEGPGPTLDGEVAKDALWSDIAHVGNPAHPVSVTVKWKGGQSASWKLRGGQLPGSCEVASIELSDGSKNWQLADDGDGKWQGKIPGVSGLLPLASPTEWTSHLDKERGAFKLSVQWLQGIRAQIPRTEKVRASRPSVLQSTGIGVARHLYFWDRAGRSEEEKKALSFVMGFYRDLGFELQIIDVASGYFKVAISPAQNSGVLVNLIDTGEGLSQVLAPLVAIARAAYGLGPPVVCMEQPELHLHTDAQRALARSLVQAAKDGAQIFIETHSEVLLAAMQLAIARKEAGLCSEDVSLYWVDRRANGMSFANYIPLNDAGQVNSEWPVDAFDDLLDLKTELLAARRAAS